ncbi:MAG: hypothetical protein HPY66_0940 [Firmicutes bacterium]|nr:hypothetical protein [Bacillota bacterium]MDI6705935.1 hypothetical protein [Bacillota bacterium]MDI6705938.1 hypothetical protein [Bacillota bacterium]
MGQFSELWLYCKETFGIVKRRPFLFVPRLVFMGLLLSSVFFVGGIAFVRLLPGRWMNVFPLGILVIGFLVGNLVVEGGQINLYKKAALGYTVGMDDFGEGVRKFVGRVFIGGLMLLLLIALMSFLMVGFVTIPLLGVLAGIALVIAIFAVNVLLSAWKAALAFKDIGVMDAFSDSWRFVREFFWPMALVVFVKGLFDGNNNNNSGSNQGNNFNINGINVNLNIPGLNMFGLNQGFSFGVRSAMALIALIPFVVAAAIISIAATVYIEQLIFVIYARRESL